MADLPELLKFALSEVLKQAERENSDSVGRAEYFCRTMPEHADRLRAEAAAQYFQRMIDTAPGRAAAVLVQALQDREGGDPAERRRFSDYLSRQQVLSLAVDASRRLAS